MKEKEFGKRESLAGKPENNVKNSHHKNNTSSYNEQETSLKKPKDLKSIILNITSELYASFNKDMLITWVNKATAKSVNKTLQEIIGKHCYEIWQNSHQPC
ncbi:MAG: hypothetical protein KGY75_03315 [Candidatus Cloacimonetes bacterium]|nr:hypothetical protein [Candidatus Cloacimonadota bacterium]MBS3767138.1 hypothetical protein [Candidatus Cloacimonadota bacterium]